MKIELKKIQVNNRMSEETTCFSADLWIDGSKVGTAHNHGHGGPTEVRANYSVDGYDKEAVKAIDRAEEYCKGLPPYVSKDGSITIPMDLEMVIDALLDTHSIEQAEKTMKRKFATHLVWGVPKGGSYVEVKLRYPIATMLMTEQGKQALRQLIDRYRKDFTEGEAFFNTNIPKDLLT